MELRGNASTEDLLSFESGAYSAEVNQATVSSMRSLASEATSVPAESLCQTPEAARRPSSLHFNVWESSEKLKKSPSSGQVKKNIPNKVAQFFAVVRRSKISDFKFRFFLVLLFCSIVGLVTFTWFLYKQKLVEIAFDDKIWFHEAQRRLNLQDKGKVRLTGYLGLNIPSKLGPYNCQNVNHVPEPNICMEWKYRARLQIEYWHERNLSCYNVHWKPLSHNTDLRDCFNLQGALWYGMGEVQNISWPLSSFSLNMQPYVTGDVSRDDLGSVLDRYWLSSEGIAIHVNPEIPLYVSLNESGNEQLCFETKHQIFPYHVFDDVLGALNYTLCIGPDMKSVHVDTMHKFYNFPPNISSSKFLEGPVWATGPKLGTSLSQESLQVYANHIMEHGFEAGNILIDTRWQTQEGDLQFQSDNFTNPEEILNILHHKGFKVLLAVHPYVCLDSVAFKPGTDETYFISDDRWHVPQLIRWQNSVCAVIDVTSERSAKWFMERLQEVKLKYRVDGFVFLGGQTSYLPTFYNFETMLVNPDIYLTRYLEISSKVGSFMGAGIGFNTQNIPAFVAMASRTSTWDAISGLRSILPTVLTLGLLGYPIINPGSVGGDVLIVENATLPDKELYVRWLQLAAFMPVVQFSVPPGDYDLDVIKAAKVLFKVREERVLPVMQRGVQEYLQTGNPILRPLWWLEPKEYDAQISDTQFSIGEEILVAPVLEEGKRNRDIYLPKGWWRDELLGYIHRGGKWLHNYSVPIDKIAYFSRTEKLS